MIRQASKAELSDWNYHIAKSPNGGNILQTKEYANFKKISGWNSVFLFIDDVATTVLEKNAPLLGKIWYIPKGPNFKSTKDLVKVKPAIEKFAKTQNVFMVKIDPEITYSDDNAKLLAENGFIQVPKIQPNQSTIILDISNSAEELLKNFNQKTRHAINRAKREGVSVQPVDTTDENCRILYDLYSTSAEGRWRARDYDYYKRFWQLFSSAKAGQMFFTYYEGELIAAAFVLMYENTAQYKDGASVRTKQVYGASHLLQWEIIVWLKSRNITHYDLCGTPPSSEINNKEHPYYGFGKFKLSFSKEVTDFIGTYDIITNSLKYTIWTSLLEKIVKRVNFAIGKSYWF